jgi:carboxypeptidase Q
MRIVTWMGGALLACAVAAGGWLNAQTDWIDAYRDPAARLIGESLATHVAWDRLAELTDTYGHRLSGSAALEAAIRWAEAEMKKDGLENVRLEPVKVPHWVRGQESAEIVAPRRHQVAMLGLGNSVGTPAAGVEAEVIAVRTFQELDAAAARVRGRIVLFNVPFTTYGETVRYRGGGPSRAAALGAVAVARPGCERRTPARSTTPRTRRRFPRRRLPPRTPTASSGCSIAGTPFASG